MLLKPDAKKQKPQTSYKNVCGLYWLPNKDSNLDKRCQRPVCYRYTIRQCFLQLRNYSKAISENQYEKFTLLQILTEA